MCYSAFAPWLPVLVDSQFDREWAEAAGRMAFQEAESPNGDNVVVFLNLALFWYSVDSLPVVLPANCEAARRVQYLGQLEDATDPGKALVFLDVLGKFACGLYKVHASAPFPLTDEPKNMTPETLREFKPANSRARLSILTHNSILISEHGSTVQAADDIEDLGLEDADPRGPVSADQNIAGCISQISREVGAASSQLPITINPFIPAETVNACALDSSLGGSMLGLGMDQIEHIDDCIMDLLRQEELLQQEP
ncbi:hypothetical protein CBS147320_10045 [Aspergillus niger]|nr:hypothetical protein CBS147320_10045 [Aspergillus niger]KAI2942702.1 hypothetical protein CBS147322_8766 [Aspergillus niger]